MPRRKGRNKTQQPPVGEDVRRATNLALQKFLNSTAKEYEFPSSLSAAERAYVHDIARILHLRSKSRGTGLNRYITVYKREGSTIVQEDANFHLSKNSRNMIVNLLNKNPLSVKEKQDVMPLTERDRNHAPEGSLKDSMKQMGRLNNGVPLIPSSSNLNQELLPHRQSLPIWPQRESILQCINDNQVVIISGETGSGKTTQVPQLIMEYHSSIARTCRIVCCEPRRISAVMTAERVSLERNTKVGTEVGYQIRHESKISPSTILAYCTTGVLLRTLMGNDSGFATITHLIIDEVHERDRFSDFILITLRDVLSKYRSMKLILMSATLDTQIFSKYFNNCPVLTVPGRLYEVQEYFLEDILRRTGYMTKEMMKLKRNWDKKRQQKTELDKWVSSMTNISLDDDKKNDSTANNCNNSIYNNSSSNRTPILGQHSDNYSDKPLQDWVIRDMDNYLEQAWLGNANDSEQAFKQLLVLIRSENVSVDYQHTNTGITSLMVAAGKGFDDIVEQLLTLGASLSIQASNNFTALDFAIKMEREGVIDLIKAYMTYYPCKASNVYSRDNGGNVSEGSDVQLTEEDNQLLDIYKNCFSNEEAINGDLIVAIINEIQASNKKGSVLIFLPGYDDIISIRDKIKARESKSKELKINLMTLYSKMSTTDQKRVFPPAPSGVRKIILSTNIAETSITIDDVVFVIDSGRVKERCFDSLSGVTMLKSMKISQACARQRRGRAGRTQPGICYHLFSSIEYREMQQFQTPEILRTPLHELCLQTKLLAPANTPIADFLAKAIDPPSFMVTRNAVQLLKTIDALDAWEDLTQLGHHLLDLPVDPHLGKMLLYSVVLKCLDPVLTIVASLSYRDPFVMPDLPPLRRAVAEFRSKFSAKSFSDHMILLRVFQGWLAAKEKGTSRLFCEQNFLSEATLEMILSHRTQILQQMRSVGFVKNRGTHNQGQAMGDLKDLNTNSESWPLIKAALTGGLYPNLARADREAGHNTTLRTQREFKVLLHPSSSLRDISRGGASQAHNAAISALPSDWVLYEELSRTGNLCHIRMCTVVSPVTVAIFAGPARLPVDCLSDPETMDPGSDSEEEEVTEGKTAILKLDDWIMFRIDPEAAKLALTLRFKWHALLMRRLRAPNKASTQADDNVINSIAAVLSEEENLIGLQQPTGIGARPKQFSTDNYTTCEKTDFSSAKSYNSGSPSPTPSHGSSSDSHNNGTSSTAIGGTGVATGNGSARYFVIKASPKTMEPNLAAKSWPFTNNTEKKIVRAYKDGFTVILVFGLQGSGHFQGYARLVSDKTDQTDSSSTSMDLSGTNFNLPLPIEWIKRGEIPYNCTRHLLNPYNDHNKVQTSRDGQEIEPNVGERLCHLWDKIPPPMPWAKNAAIPPQNMFHQMAASGVGFGRPIRGPYQPNHNQYQHQHSNNSYSHPPPYINPQRKT